MQKDAEIHILCIEIRLLAMKTNKNNKTTVIPVVISETLSGITIIIITVIIVMFLTK
jgi:hypothetical protein